MPYGLQQLGLKFELKGGTSLSKGFGIIGRFFLVLRTPFSMAISNRDLRRLRVLLKRTGETSLRAFPFVLPDRKRPTHSRHSSAVTFLSSITAKLGHDFLEAAMISPQYLRVPDFIVGELAICSCRIAMAPDPVMCSSKVISLASSFSCARRPQGALETRLWRFPRPWSSAFSTFPCLRWKHGHSRYPKYGGTTLELWTASRSLQLSWREERECCLCGWIQPAV